MLCEQLVKPVENAVFNLILQAAHWQYVPVRGDFVLTVRRPQQDQKPAFSPNYPCALLQLDRDSWRGR